MLLYLLIRERAMELIDDYTKDSVSAKSSFVSVEIKSYISHDDLDFVKPYNNPIKNDKIDYGNEPNSSKTRKKTKTITRTNGPTVAMTSMKHTGEYFDNEVTYCNRTLFHIGTFYTIYIYTCKMNAKKNLPVTVIH